MKQAELFDDDRMNLAGAIELTAQSLTAYGADRTHWQLAYSGGKDSSATVAIAIHLIETGRIPKPKKLTVTYADTRQELPPLHHAAMTMGEEIKRRGYNFQVACADMDKRFWVNILGRGVIPLNNGRARWCTRQIKGNPMEAALRDADLVITGVRIGESAARDQRITASCSKDGGECGQGWFQHGKYGRAATLAPIAHWRVCHVWDWLWEADLMHGFPTGLVAEAYSMETSDGEEAMSARTGCIGCPLVSDKDTALARLIAKPEWAYLSPLEEVRSLHDWLRLHGNRHRKDGTETLKSGKLAKNPGRIGCITLEARIEGLRRLLDIQRRVNEAAHHLCRPEVYLVSAEEEKRICELVEMKTYPNGWTGSEPLGTTAIDEPERDGVLQFSLF
jgi:DNA sulfur modification protein DndC